MVAAEQTVAVFIDPDFRIDAGVVGGLSHQKRFFLIPFLSSYRLLLRTIGPKPAEIAC